MDSFVYQAKKNELEPKYTSVPNVLLCWTPPLVLQAINTLFLHNLAEVIHRLQGREADPQGIPVQHTEHSSDMFFGSCKMHWSSHTKTPQDPNKQDGP